jgi:hypothetical protein
VRRVDRAVGQGDREDASSEGQGCGSGHCVFGRWMHPKSLGTPSHFFWGQMT